MSAACSPAARCAPDVETPSIAHGRGERLRGRSGGARPGRRLSRRPPRPGGPRPGHGVLEPHLPALGSVYVRTVMKPHLGIFPIFSLGFLFLSDTDFVIVIP